MGSFLSKRQSTDKPAAPGLKTTPSATNLNSNKPAAGTTTSPKESLAVSQKATSSAENLQNVETKDEYKILVLGELGVGKTNLLLRFCDNQYIEEDPTHTKPPPDTFLQGQDFKTRNVRVGGEVVKIRVIDTLGNEKFRCVSSSVYSQLDGIMVVFGLDNKDSLLKCQSTWLREVGRYCKDDAQQVLIGNKVDLPAAERQADVGKAQAIARDCDNIPYLETSAKTGAGVDEAFMALIKLIKALKLRKEGKELLD